MSTKFLIGIGVGFFAIFALAVAAVVGINTLSESSTQSVAAAPAPVVALASEAPTFLRPVATVAPLPPREVSTFQSAGPSTGVAVQNSDIDQLASAVRLGDKTASVGKEVWAKETPVAQRLLNGLCDCDQRNWLKHFVETGNEAISGSEHYYESVQLLSTLRRSNQDLAAQVVR